MDNIHYKKPERIAWYSKYRTLLIEIGVAAA